MQQDVLGLDVAVNDAVAVGVIERIRHIPRNAHRFIHAELRFAVQLGAKRLSLDVRHHIVQESICRTTVEQREDVRML